MALPARRLTEWNTWRGPTRSSSSTGGTTTTMIRRLEEGRRKPGFLDAEVMRPPLCRRVHAFRKPNEREWRISTDVCRKSTCRPPVGCPSERRDTKPRWLAIVGAVLPALAVDPSAPAGELAMTTE